MDKLVGMVEEPQSSDLDPAQWTLGVLLLADGCALLGLSIDRDRLLKAACDGGAESAAATASGTAASAFAVYEAMNEVRLNLGFSSGEQAQAIYRRERFALACSNCALALCGLAYKAAHTARQAG